MDLTCPSKQPGIWLPRGRARGSINSEELGVVRNSMEVRDSVDVLVVSITNSNKLVSLTAPRICALTVVLVCTH